MSCVSAYNCQMTLLKIATIFGLTVCVFPMISCSVNSPKNANSLASARSDQSNSNGGAVGSNVEELALIVKVPYDAEDLVWKDFPAQKRIIAVMRLSPADSARLIADAEKIKAPEAATISSETWFPAELIAQADMSGGDELKGMAYAADQFFLEPYSKGRIIKIENTDYFELELSAK